MTDGLKFGGGLRRAALAQISTSQAVFAPRGHARSRIFTALPWSALANPLESPRGPWQRQIHGSWRSSQSASRRGRAVLTAHRSADSTRSGQLV